MKTGNESTATMAKKARKELRKNGHEANEISFICSIAKDRRFPSILRKIPIL
jgi:hypothetical protein